MNPHVYGTHEFDNALRHLFAPRVAVVMFAHFDKLATSSRWSLFQSLIDVESYFDRFVVDSFRLDNTRQSLRNGDIGAYDSLQASINQVTFYLTNTSDFLDHNPLLAINTSDSNELKTLIDLEQEEHPLLIEFRLPNGNSHFAMIEDDDDMVGWKIPRDSTLRAFSLDQSYDYMDVVVAKRPLLPSDDLELNRLVASFPSS